MKSCGQQPPAACKMCRQELRPPSLPHRRKVSQGCQHCSSISSPGLPAGWESQPSASCPSEKTAWERGNRGSADHDMTAGHCVGQQPEGLKCLISSCPGWYLGSRCQTEARRLQALLSYEKFAELQNFSPITRGNTRKTQKGC